jgi:hypothetical protein
MSCCSAERGTHEPRVGDRAEEPARERQGRTVLGVRVPLVFGLASLASEAVLTSRTSAH